MGLNPAIALCAAWLALCLAPAGDCMAGDARYTNPVIHADYSDPDALRTDDGYYMTSSSFSHVPGLPILHSNDLVHWRIVNHAIPRLPPGDHFDRPQHGNGVWAPSFRRHDGRFYIFYGDPDFGIYVVTADDPRAEWSEPYLLKPGKGLIDPAPFWDDDGKAYLVHAWAKSRAGFNNVLTLHSMSPDGRSVLDEGKIVVDGNTIEGWFTIEGPKLYKRDGWYYIFAPAGGVRNGWQGVFRARSIHGPYEHRIVLEQGDTEINGPHQGAWLTTSAGDDWFLHFQDKDTYGRIVHLQPLRWIDGWPVMGADPDGDGTGAPVLEFAAPHPEVGAAGMQPQTSDDFSDGFNLAWQWQANPQAGWLGEAPTGSLRLNAVPMPANFWEAGNLLMQKFPAEAFSAQVKMAFSPAATGDTAGLVVFGYDYNWVGLVRDGEDLLLQQHVRKEARAGGDEAIVASKPVEGKALNLRVDVGPGGKCEFSVSKDGIEFKPFGQPFTARQARWVGAKVGLFAGSLVEGEGAAAGFAEFGDWRVVIPQ
ncbi:MAG: glycoside hydrolase 43 family protein [Lysobacterales bacterium]